jgi:hypothetical protein
MNEVQTTADRIFKRNDRYNKGQPLYDMFLHKTQDITYEIYKKIRRADSLIRSGKVLEALDSFVDIINYSKMGGSFCLLEAVKHEESRQQKRTVSIETRQKISKALKGRRKEKTTA